MIHFIGGNEPYLVDCQKNALIGKLNVPEINYGESDAFHEDVVLFLSCQPIGDKCKVVYLSIDDLSACDTPLFHSFKRNCPKTAKLIIKFRTYDKRRNFYKQLQKEKLITLFNKESASRELAAIIDKETNAAGASFEPGALEEFLRRENYDTKEDITIYNILSDLRNLVAMGSQITLENVKAIIPEHEKDNVFAIAKLIQAGDINALRTQTTLLQGNEIGTLSALLREYRLAYKASFFPARDVGVGNIVFQGKDRNQLLDGINLITNSIDQIKYGAIPISVALEKVIFILVAQTKTKGTK